MLGKPFIVKNAVGEYIEVEIPEDCNTGTIASVKDLKDYTIEKQNAMGI